MRSLPLFSAAAVAATFAAPSAFGITFLTNDGGGLSGLGTATASGAAGGVTVTLTAGTTGNASQVISATTLGNNELDAGGVGISSTDNQSPNLASGESIAISFSEDVFLESLDLAGVAGNASDSATIGVGGLTFTVFGTNAEPTVDPATPGVAFTNGDDIVSFAAEEFRVNAGETVTLSIQWFRRPLQLERRVVHPSAGARPADARFAERLALAASSAPLSRLNPHRLRSVETQTAGLGA